MQKMTKAVRLSLIYGAALLLTSSYPVAVMAETMDTPPVPAASTASETSQTTTGTTQTAPVSLSSDAASAAPVPSPDAVPAPATTSVPPATPKETYTFNPETGRWDSNKWQYNPATGKYERPPEPVQASESGPQTTAPPVIVAPGAPTVSAASQPAQQPAYSALDTSTRNAIANAIESDALSGDAAVQNNTEAGNAITGDATAAATIINSVNSTVSNDSNQKAATFVSDVMGDVRGDIILQPMLLKAMLEAGTESTPQDLATVTTTSRIINDINLKAVSGNALVAGNTSAGNATTGNANTVANILNIVNSMVSANRSFVGTINIYGNLDGDILIAPDFIPQMLANNGAVANAPTTNPTAVSSKDTQTIVNNVALAAESGKAIVAGNTTAGSATSGDANTNVVLFNLTGREIVASNSLLVFVNVLGKWVGVIVDAPTGATSAAIGNGVTTYATTSPDLVINATTNTLLTNNINLTSLSGNATISENTRAGNATTGNATASANIGNIVGTRMGLSDWFGVLFINVFGSWNGSFGIDTSSGNPVMTAEGSGPSPSGQSAKQTMRVIEFIPNNGKPSGHSPSHTITVVGERGNGNYTAAELSNQPQEQPQITLASATQGSEGVEDTDLFAALAQDDSRPTTNLPWLGGIIFFTGLSLVIASALSDTRKREALLK